MNAPVPFALCFAALFFACSSAEERADRARTDARAALEQGQRVAALAAIADLHAVQPESAEAVLELTELLIAAGEAPQAVWVLERGLADFPDRDDLRLALGRAALLTGDPSHARRALLEVPAASEQHPVSLLLLAQAELMLGDLERGLAVLEAGAERYPDLPQMRISRIAALIREHRIEEAHAAVTEARSGVSEAALHEVRQLEATIYGLAFAEGIDLADGRATLERADESLSEVQKAAAEEQKAARVAASRERALVRLRELVLEDPANLELWQAAATAYWRAGRAPEASEMLAQRLTEDPDQVGLYPYVAWLHAAQGQEAEAETAMREFASRSQSPSGYIALAGFHSRRGNNLEALATLDDGLDAFPETPLLLKARTETLIGLSRVAEAREELARFEAAAPHAQDAEYLRGQIELTEGDAEAAAERLLRLVPTFDNAGTQFWLGRALEALGDRSGAERRYRLAFTREPKEGVLARSVIHLAEQRGDWPMVTSYAQRLLAVEPLAEDGWAALLRALIQLDQGDSAERVGRRGVEVLPESALLRALLVRSLLANERYDEALLEVGLAAEKLGDDPTIEAERALGLGMRGEVALGLEVARAALERHPEAVRLHVAIAALEFEQRDRAAGSQAIDRALALEPEDPSPLRLRAEFLASTGAWDGALADCDRYLALRPDDPVLHHVRGVVLAGAGRADDAIAAYERAAALDRTAFAPRNNLAELLRERGDLDRALDWAQKAFSLASGDPYVADTLGWLYLEKGLVKRSVGLLEEAHAGAPDHPVVQLHLALAYRADDRRADARRLLTDLLQRSRGNAPLQAEVEEALHSVE